MSGEVSFFELGVGDVDRARAFYGGLFGWAFSDQSGGVSVETPNVRGGIHGGDVGARPYVFFAVDDLDAALERMRELGGEVETDLGGDGEEAGFGRFVLCVDDQGSRFGLHQPPRSS